MAKVITITLRKGGSGKTTTAVNLASALSKHHKKVLLIDLDPQANATASLGLDGTKDLPTVTELLQGTKPLQQVITNPNKGFDFIASNNLLSQVEPTLTSDPTKYAPIIRQLIEPIKAHYDYIVIDTPPSESMLTISALVASDYAVIPTQAHYLAMHGLQQALELINRIQQAYNTNVVTLGIVPTMVQSGTNMAELLVDQIKADYGDIVLPYSIPYTIRITESQLAGEPILDYEPAHPASIAYLQLAKHINEVTK